MIKSNFTLSISARQATARSHGLVKAWHYFRRALCLRCPICGLSPLYPPAHEAHNLLAWFATLPGCDKCGYDYQREPGYFLTVAWLLNWQVVFAFGLLSFIFLEDLFKLPFLQLLFFNAVFTLIIITLTVRHTKALFMAVDHLLDPVSSEDFDHSR